MPRLRKERILHIIHPGNTFADAAIFADGCYPAFAEPLEKSQLIFFPKKDFLDLLLQHSQSIEARKQERKLYLPIGWDNLHGTLCQSWHELHLVDKPSIKSKVVPAVEEPSVKLKLLLQSHLTMKLN